MKQPIRYFSIGLLTASLIILIIVYFFDKPDNHANKGSVDEMIATIKDEGYHVLSSSEYISLSVATESEDNNPDVDEAEESTDEEDSNEAQDEEDEEDEEETVDPEETEVDEVHEYTLIIEPNMLGPTISQLLEDNNVIDDADEFSRYLETEGYAQYLQLGEHDVSSDMTLYEIAEVIARSR